MLDQFALSKPELKAPALSSGPGRPQPEPAAALPTEGISDEDFAKQLQAGMADLLGEMETSPDMQAQFEKMMKELSGAADLEEPASAAGASKGGEAKDKTGPAGTAAEESFQATIQKTMERMRLSGDSATAAAASSDTDDIMAEMLKAMQGGDLGEGSDEDFSNMILGMMEQLTNKEILYEPMKELDQKFPDWLQKNATKTAKEDLKRYKEQQVYVREIVGKFEEKTYADSNAPDREYIVERMQKVCPDPSILITVLMCCRCKQLALRPRISWGIWQRLKKRSEHLRKAVQHSREREGNASIQYSEHVIPIDYLHDQKLLPCFP
jgi:peroxin-19